MRGPISSTLRVAAVQMASGPDRDRNLHAATRLVLEAASRGARLVVLPEMFNVLGDPDILRSAGEPLEGPSLTWAAQAARHHAVWLVAGSVMESVAGEARCFNTSCLLDPHGGRRAVYRKIHLFDNDVPGATFRESDRVLAGSEVVTAGIGEPSGGQPGAKAGEAYSALMGFAICYDLRFSALFRTMALRGARAIALPSAFTDRTGRDHWEILVRARAIENQVFMIAANQCGATPKGMAWHGHSMIVDAWGNVLARAGTDETVILADLDFAAQEKVRNELPSLAWELKKRGRADGTLTGDG